MDLALEVAMAAVLLAVELRAAWQGNPRPSLFAAGVAGICAVLLIVKSDPHGDMFLAVGFAIASAAIGLIGRRPSKPPSEA